MMSRALKAAFYRIAGPAMLLNAAFYRLFRAHGKSPLKIHLGPGQRNYIQGWVNVDANMFTGRCDLWLDLNNNLPFRDGSVDAAYSHHVMEHLSDMPRHLADIRRCLKPGGIYRIGVPNADSAMMKFMEGDPSWFGDFPDKRRSVGGRLDNFLLCRNEHLAVMTESYLRELLEDAGFTGCRKFSPSATSGAIDLFRDCLAKEEESDPQYPHTLILEATK